ncbi:Uma2 family endonuclease [Alienimonas californiensis]|uniref:Putative restriction endonuclease domain-containing protein n=1 Tax=Alienimonas californiensis TaxID=2527989 RepID=A0A517P7K0_9PLAN|nr:Uma2 family endonuclease [Alienimonas californiensis]QDT15325.1 hypothetical protein CA12_14090 [Alienimonas californiensis]
MNAPATLSPSRPRAATSAWASPPAGRPAGASGEPTTHRVTVAEYHAMRDANVFPPDGPKLELLDGEILEMPAPGPLHASTVDGIAGRLLRRLPDGWFVRVQNPVTFLTSEPLPDLLVVAGEGFDWRDRHPGPEDAALLIEVSDSSLSFDRHRKARVYAAAGVTPYWIVNLVDRRVEVHDEPSPGDGAEENPPGYRRRDVSPGETLSFRVGDATITLDAADLLPPAPGAPLGGDGEPGDA